MKKLYILSALLLFWACSDDDGEFITPVTHTINVNFNEDYGSIAAGGVTLTLNNIEDGRSYTATTTSAGAAEIEVTPGNYTVNASLTMSADDYEQAFNKQTTGEVYFNTSTTISISETGVTSTDMILESGQVGDLLIKQLYFAGSDAKLGANFRDQFIEIHNNSNDIIFLDGLYIAQVKGATSTSGAGKENYLADGQYDWSLSAGQTDQTNANSGYVYLEEVLQIPGNGSDYPLESGKSVIVAATAVNHKAPLVAEDKNGETVTYEVENPDLTVDLSQAQFEGYYADYQTSIGQNPLTSDIDNPNSVNLNIIFKTFKGNDLILDTNGREAIVIFSATDEELNSWNRIPLPTVTNVSETTATFMQVPASFITDGVMCQNTDPSKQTPARLPNTIDAGDKAVIKGRQSSESIIRKVKSTDGDKVFYQDTNNSANDFEVLSHPEVIIQ
ncbi:DUF4876 domain-containing protein [Fulvivirga maritima]|uniref:DUF4876 domain-containing protein n=1 Tax=Fulvivirga maritima TaxID=2904247 RepID=UPI001F44F3D2|nr:DUF4876 domain-containing protein [Fulvivirga maritima]UII25362.1 DUF4876 domain-containing protein [Fulvivirga maritima]